MKQGLSKDDILRIARAKGSFSVSLRWRDDRLRGKCRQLVRDGLLTGGRKIIHGTFVFFPKEKPDGDV